MEENKENENLDKNWFSKHAETLTLMITLIVGFVWINEKMDSKFDKVNERLASVEKDIAVIKTVLSLKEINCSELASRESHEIQK